MPATLSRPLNVGSAVMPNSDPKPRKAESDKTLHPQYFYLIFSERAGEGEFSFGFGTFSFGARTSTVRVKEKASGQRQ